MQVTTVCGRLGLLAFLNGPWQFHSFIDSLSSRQRLEKTREWAVVESMHANVIHRVLRHVVSEWNLLQHS